MNVIQNTTFMIIRELVVNFVFHSGSHTTIYYALSKGDGTCYIIIATQHDIVCFFHTIVNEMEGAVMNNK